MSIKSKLPIISMSIISIAIIGFSIIYSIYISRALVQSTKSNMSHSLDIGAITIENLMATRKLDIENLAQNSLIQETLSKYIDDLRYEYPSYRPGFSGVNAYLEALRATRDDISAAFIISPSGYAIASSDVEGYWIDLSDRQYFIDAMNGQTTISNLLVDRLNGDSVLFVAAPIHERHTRRIIGVIVNIIDEKTTSESLNKLVNPNIGTAYLTNDEGMTIFHPDIEEIGSYHSDPPIQEYFANKSYGERGVLEFSEHGEEHYIMYKQIPNTPWIIVIEQHLWLINVSAYNALFVMISIAILILLASAIAFILYARTITVPITILSDVMKQTSSGDLSARSNYEGKDELGQLSFHLNQMLDELITTYEEVESKNEELIAQEEELRINNEFLEANQIALEESQQTIQTLAFMHPLTKQPNRLAYMFDLEQALNNKIVDDASFSIYQLDIDNFMRINDSLGHDFGDEVLIALTSRLKSIETDTLKLYHLSADEYAFIDYVNTDDIHIIRQMEKVFQLIKLPFDFEERTVHLSMSAGISIFPNDDVTVAKLVQNADTAMYQAKKSGRSTYIFYKKIMSEAVRSRIEVEDLLHGALDNQLVSMHFQPQYSTDKDTLCCFESLMRIRTTDNTPVSPEIFIPVAEETGHIISLGNWALRHVCSVIKDWRDKGYSFSHISVNVSAIQLKESEFLDTVNRIVKEADIDPNDLEFEITESVLIDQLSSGLDILSEIKNQGYKVALDDFGTGYSSLSYLRTMQLTTLKIDKSFIDSLAYSKKDQEIIRQMIQIAHELGLKTVAEGVETVEQLDVLRYYHCDLIQGYYFSKPLPIVEAEHLLSQQ